LRERYYQPGWTKAKQMLWYLAARPMILRTRTEPETSGKWPKKPPPLTREQLDAYDAFIEHWLEILPKSYGLVERFNHSFPVRHSRPGFHRTIEIGAGLGEHLRHEHLTAEQEANYCSVEIREQIADRLRASYPRISVIVGDCQRHLPFPDGHFDRYLAVHVLEHLPDLSACVKEAWRLLDKQRGQLLAVIPCEGGWAYSLARRISAQRIFEREHRMPYAPVIANEHLNRPHEIVAELSRYFVLERRRLFPLPFIPVVSANLCLGLALRPRPEPL
jgi:SAM-dependent methyltransferase